MPVGGYFCVRFHGRLYVFYSPGGSCPSLLGKFLLGNIPTDPQEYQDWLSKTRLQYQDYERVLDEKVLTLPEQRSPIVYSTPSSYRTEGCSLSVALWQFHVDERLDHRLPAFCEEPRATGRKWIYVVDLDHEEVRIKSSSKQTSANLRSARRQLEVAQAWKKSPKEKVEDSDQPDHGTLAGHPVTQSLLGSDGSNTSASPLHRALDPFKARKVTAKTLPRPSKHLETGYLVRELLLSRFIESWNEKLSTLVLRCHHSAFIFREVAFAILSLACGDFSLVAYQSSKYSMQGSARLGSPYGSKILPHFGTGFHLPNVLPGSAPENSHYWFHGVLVVLANRLEYVDGFEAAVSRVAGARGESQHRIFDTIITNIQSFILLRVQDEDIVQYTDLIELFGPVSWSSHVETAPQWLEACNPSPSLRCNLHGLGILMNFFETVALYTLGPLISIQKTLPNEIKDKIIEMLDVETYARCSQVSYSFRHHVHRHVRLSHQPSLNSTPFEKTDFTHRIIKNISTTSKPIVFHTGHDKKTEGSSLVRQCDSWSVSWRPVIGHGCRSSHVVDCGLFFELWDGILPLTKFDSIDFDDSQFVSLLNHVTLLASRKCPSGVQNIYVTKITGVSDMSFMWSRFLASKLLKWKLTSKRCMPGPSQQRQGTLPPNISVLTVTCRSGNGRDSLLCFEYSLLFWFRESEHNECQAERDVKKFLGNRRLHQAEGHWPAREGRLVLASSTRTQHLDWRIYDVGDVNDSVRVQLRESAISVWRWWGSNIDLHIPEDRDRFDESLSEFLD